jgi:hypothetical protein
MSDDYLMNIASVLFFLYYIPEFYANYVNKNANVNNVLEKVVMLVATTFAFTYSLKTNNQALIINYGPAFALDMIALSMRSYYAYLNRNVTLHETSQLATHDVENPMHDVETPL